MSKGYPHHQSYVHFIRFCIPFSDDGKNNLIISIHRVCHNVTDTHIPLKVNIQPQAIRVAEMVNRRHENQWKSYTGKACKDAERSVFRLAETLSKLLCPDRFNPRFTDEQWLLPTTGRWLLPLVLIVCHCYCHLPKSLAR